MGGWRMVSYALCTDEMADVFIRVSLVKHPRLMEICKERDIAVEICPIS